MDGCLPLIYRHLGTRSTIRSDINQGHPDRIATGCFGGVKRSVGRRQQLPRTCAGNVADRDARTDRDS